MLGIASMVDVSPEIVSIEGSRPDRNRFAALWTGFAAAIVGSLILGLLSAVRAPRLWFFAFCEVLWSPLRAGIGWHVPILLIAYASFRSEGRSRRVFAILAGLGWAALGWLMAIGVWLA